MIFARSLRARLLAAALLVSPFALSAHPPIQPPAGDAPANDSAAQFEADRAAILAMAGNFRVRFDMQESTRWQGDYTPLDPKKSGGHEVVRLIADTGRHISLQHLLVIEHEGQTHIIKHWRQDWDFEPSRVLVYSDRNRWSWQEVPANERGGRWSQTVYQVDDSPRYGGWGRFDSDTGVRRWQSSWSWRPLARRDATRNPVYDRYLSINRQGPSPDGWVHWQDNTKLALDGGTLRPVVQEYVINSYTRFDGFNVAAADAYWAQTSGYWAAIRNEWARIAAQSGGIAITEEAQTGTIVSGRLLSLADEIVSGDKTEQSAITEALTLMRDATGVGA